jgi:hypothetical protein
MAKAWLIAAWRGLLPILARSQFFTSMHLARRCGRHRAGPSFTGSFFEPVNSIFFEPVSASAWWKLVPSGASKLFAVFIDYDRQNDNNARYHLAQEIAEAKQDEAIGEHTNNASAEQSSDY